MLISYVPTDRKKFHIYGRNSERNLDFLPLFWTGSGIEFKTDSGEVWLDLESEYAMREEWIRMEVDGVCMQRCIVPKGRSRICVFRGFSMDQVRTVRILKESQPKPEDSDRFFLIHAVLCDGVIHEIGKKCRKLEFIGDSLSSGEGLSGPAGLVSSCSGVFGLEGHYAVCTADSLEADFRIMSQSGWGVYCAWDNNLENIMPRYYEQVCGIMKGSKNIELGAQENNNFLDWRPDAVIVNLGSNDGFALNNPAWINPVDGRAWKQRLAEDGKMDKDSTDHFEMAVLSFLRKIRRYNPDAWMIWAYGMIDHVMKIYLEAAVEKYQEESKDQKVKFVCLPAGAKEWLGSNNHPGIRTHKEAADVLIKELKKCFAGDGNSR